MTKTKCDYDGIKRGSVLCREPAAWHVTFAEMRGPVAWKIFRQNYCNSHERASRNGAVTSRGTDTVVVYKRVGRRRLETEETQ